MTQPRALRMSHAGLHPAVAIVMWSLPIALAILTIGLVMVLREAPEDAWALPLYGLIVATWGVTGAFVTTRRPDNRIGWLLWLIGVGLGLALTGQAWAHLSIAEFDGTLPGTVAAAMLGLLFGPTLVLVVLVPMLFPDGHFMSRRWAAAGVVIIVISVLVLIGTALQPGPIEGAPEVDNPLGSAALADVTRALVELGSLGFLPALVIGIAAAVVRFRRGSAVERKQIKWFGSVLVLALSMFLTASVLPQPYAQWAWVVASLSIALIPIAIGVAVLRYRLYEIDRLISRTIGWALVTGLLVGAFALLVLGSSAVLEPLTGGNTLAVAGSTLVVALLFAPLRSRVQRAVDRRFDRSRYDGERTLAAFGERLRDEVDLPTIRADVLATVETSVRPTRVGLWLRGPGGEA